jgi:MoxR-vWA-beta-propeller ternary system domain bpX2
MTLENATCARIPSLALASLARLRRSEGVSVILDGDHAWVFWDPGDAQVLRAVLPIDGVELYEKRGNAWHRSGRRLPSFEGSPPGEPIPLSRAVTPAPFSAMLPREDSPPTLPLRLWRDARPRPTTAALCSLVVLGKWADTALSSEIGAIRGAVLGDSALLLGRGLPPWPRSTRYWGSQLLVPIGYQVRPCLPETTIIEALGSLGRELLRIIPDGAGDGQGLSVEAIPFDIFRPLSRAGVRLALVGASTS